MVKKLFKLLKKPGKTIVYVKELWRVKKFLGISAPVLFGYIAKITANRNFHKYLDKKIADAKKICPDSKLGGWIDIIDCYIIYIAVRKAKPKIVLETGLAGGGSSAFILQALEDNGAGKLYSIDLPGNDAVIYPKIGKNFNIHVPEGWQPGWLIPNWLQKRHEEIFGDSEKELPELLKRIGKVDVFLHDSLHTDEHINMEFGKVFLHLNKKSILLCDDVNEEWSTAFKKFCEKKKIPHIVFNKRLGIGAF